VSELWKTWLGDAEPGEVLRLADQAVAQRRFRSRLDAFIDFAQSAIRSRAPDVPETLTASSLAARLLEYAESSETVGP
jgi:hypothetical protein